MKFIKSLSDLPEKYDTLACDIYGVLHDGYESYPYTIQTLDRLQKMNQDVVLLSNSSRMYTALSQHLLDKFNISTNAYNDILSSGKLSRLFLEDCQTYLDSISSTLSQQQQQQQQPTASCHATLCSISRKDQRRSSQRLTATDFCNSHDFGSIANTSSKIRFFIAGDLDYLFPVYQGLGHFEPTEDCWQQMNFVLLGSVKRLYGNVDVDPFDEESVKAHYTPFLQACLAKGVPVVCTNPDVVAPAGVNPDGSQRLLICPGYIGELYEKLGGQVLYFGKPFSSIYDYLVSHAARGQQQIQGGYHQEATRRILCAGDNVATDVFGANGAGLDVVLILGGVHATTFGSLTDLELDNDQQQCILDQVRILCQEAGTQEPTYVMPYLRFD